MAMQSTRTFSSACAHLRSRAPAPVCQSSAQRLSRSRPVHTDVSRVWQSIGAPVQQQQQHRARVQPRHVQQPAWLCRSSIASQATPEPIPDDVNLELNPAPDASEVLYDEAAKTVRIPLAAVADGQRRTKMVMFTCNKCGGRSARLVNPVAWARGAVFCQCQHCQVWHMLKADKSIVEEIRYNDPDWQMPKAQEGKAAAAAEAAALAANGGLSAVTAPGSEQSTGTGAGLSLGAAADVEEVTSKPQQQ